MALGRPSTGPLPPMVPFFCSDRVTSFKIRFPATFPFAVSPLVAGLGLVALIVLLLLSQILNRAPISPTRAAGPDLLYSSRPELPRTSQGNGDSGAAGDALPAKLKNTKKLDDGMDREIDGKGEGGDKKGKERQGGAEKEKKKKKKKRRDEGEAGRETDKDGGRGRGLGEGEGGCSESKGGCDLPGWVRDHFLPNATRTASLPPASPSCDLYSGGWEYDESYPLWSALDCPFATTSLSNCARLGRKDLLYSKLRWQPHGCNLPRWTGGALRELLRGKVVVMVGDSLARNQWEAMVCHLAEGVGVDRMRVEGSGSVGFDFELLDFGLRVKFVRAPWLVNDVGHQGAGGGEMHLRLEEVKGGWAKEVGGADYVVLNLGHWMTDDKIKKLGYHFFSQGAVRPSMSNEDAFGLILETVSRFVDTLPPTGPCVFFRTYSPAHFRDGDWNSGGRCDDIVPTWNESDVERREEKFRDAVITSVAAMKRPMEILDITRLSNMRNDAHIGRNAKGIRDCSHWCLPGVPDTWNELLATLVQMGGEGASAALSSS